MFGFILAFVLLVNGAALYDNPTADRLIRQSMQATYNLHLSEARTGAQTLQNQFPDHPAGYTVMAETYWWEAQADPGNKRIEEAYYRTQEQAVNKAEAALKAGKYSTVELNAYLGSLYGSYARFQVTQKQAFYSAMKAGMKAHGYAEEVYKMDKNYYDIYVGLGAFNYFASSVPSVIKPFMWLFGIRGNRELGAQQLRTAMEKGRYAQTEAQIVYYTAILEDKKYSEAFRTLEQLRTKYPDNFVLYVWTTDWFRRQGKNLEGADYFERVFQEQSKRSPLMSGYALLEKANLQLAHNRKPEALQTLERIGKLSVSDRLFSTKVQALQKKAQ